MTPRELVDEWRYFVNHFRNRRDNCTDTPHGRKLHAIYDAALVAAEAELKMAELFVTSQDPTGRNAP